jgi:hypothetical protein
MPKEKTDKTEHILNTCSLAPGFSPYKCISVHERVWAKVKQCIKSKNVYVEFSLNILRKLTNAGTPSVTKGDSQGYCLHVRMTEEV